MANITRSQADLAAFVSRFWGKVDDSAGPDECWPWTSYVEDGYGRIYFGDQMVGAHELALTFTTGEIRHPDLMTCHECGNPICCNPAHLRFDTAKSNVHDMLRHGTHNPGASKLSDEEVLTIRLRAAQGATGTSLAAEYGVSPGLITSIIRGRRRRHVGGPIRTNHGNTKEPNYG